MRCYLPATSAVLVLAILVWPKVEWTGVVKTGESHPMDARRASASIATHRGLLNRQDQRYRIAAD